MKFATSKWAGIRQNTKKVDSLQARKGLTMQAQCTLQRLKLTIKDLKQQQIPNQNSAYII
jgi:hypothetical protein